MPYGRQAVVKPLVTRRARPDGEDAKKTFEEVCANDPPTAAAIRAALIQRQNTPAGAFVGGSPSKRTMDALARALAEDPNREDDASGALSARTEHEVPDPGPSLFSYSAAKPGIIRAAIIRAAVLAALMLLLIAFVYSSPSAAAAGSTAAASASAGGGGRRGLNWPGRQLQRLGRRNGAS